MKRRHYDWISPPADVSHILQKHGEGLIDDVDICSLLPHIIKERLLTRDERYKLGDTTRFALGPREKVTQLLKYTVPHGERGLRLLVTALRNSGESAPHPGHTHWASILEAELNCRKYIHVHVHVGVILVSSPITYLYNIKDSQKMYILGLKGDSKACFTTCSQ